MHVFGAESLLGTVFHQYSGLLEFNLVSTVYCEENRKMNMGGSLQDLKKENYTWVNLRNHILKKINESKIVNMSPTSAVMLQVPYCTKILI